LEVALSVFCLYATLAVALSTSIVIFLASRPDPVDARGQGWSGTDIVTWVFGFPLVTGWFVVVTVFGEWRSVHQGQIALVPLLSIVIDTILVFLVWEFWHRKTSKELKSSGTLGLNG
jgi:hypothetical protein